MLITATTCGNDVFATMTSRDVGVYYSDILWYRCLLQRHLAAIVFIASTSSGGNVFITATCCGDSIYCIGI